METKAHALSPPQKEVRVLIQPFLTHIKTSAPEPLHTAAPSMFARRCARYRGKTMSTFDHVELMKHINGELGPFRKSQSAAMQGFAQLAAAAMAPGTIDAKTKELIALAIGVSTHCSGCIAFHTKALVKLGCTRTELEEMLAIAVYMGGGPNLMYAAEALSAFDAQSNPPVAA
jgi:AhpD family alkylhydroperoxidase